MDRLIVIMIMVALAACPWLTIALGAYFLYKGVNYE
jgi:hypothetical protein